MTTDTPWNALTRAGPCARILVVDDDAVLGSWLARIIAQSGANATVLGTWRAAADQLSESTEWKACILDVSLPDGSGLDLLARLRETARSVPVLVLTGLLDHDIANAVFDLGAQYLVKPVATPMVERFLRRADGTRDKAECPAVVMDADVSEDLRKLMHDVLQLAERQHSMRLEYAYRMALLAQAVNGRGDMTVQACASAVGVSRPTLQSYMLLTTRWTPRSVRDLLERCDSRGRAITVSDLGRVAQAPVRVREQFVAQVLRDDFDLRRFLSQMLERAGEGPGES
jgi:DNA-binding response OmpR family regulator